jgi:tRNA modification GTPase
MSDAQRQLCWVAELTPAGRGAVATIAVWGTGATELLQACFEPRGRRRLAATPLGGVRFGDWRSSGQSAEEVVVCCRALGEWEIHCHGGRAAPAAIIETLVHRGARACDSASWLVRHSLDTLELESQVALMDAATERTAAILLDQHRGALRGRIACVVEFLDCGDMPGASRMLSRLRRLSLIGLHLSRPWRVAVVGPANAGKSSLVNRLAGFQRSIVMDEPGTTRDVLAAKVAFAGWPVELIDTAGLRVAQDPVERQGVELAVQQARDADLTILLFDAVAGLEGVSGCSALLGPVLADPVLPDRPQPDRPQFGPALSGPISGIETDAGTDARLREDESRLFVANGRLLVANKVDLHGGPSPPCDICVSAKTGQGIPELVSLVLRRLTGAVEPEPGEAVPFHQRHVRAITAAAELLESGDPANASRVLVEFLAFSSSPQ